jgi:hypothetical protein
MSWDYLNLSLENEYVGDVTIPTQVIMYNQCCSRQISQSDCSIHIKLNYMGKHSYNFRKLGKKNKYVLFYSYLKNVYREPKLLIS